VRELKVVEDELGKLWGTIKAEYNEIYHLKTSYQEKLIFLAEKLSNVKNLKVKQVEFKML
jgi:hypothetical protein